MPDLLAEADRIRHRSGRTAEVVGLLADRLAELELHNEGLSRHYDAALRVIRKLTEGWTPETDDDPPVWYLESGHGDVNVQWDGTAPMSPDERRVLVEAEGRPTDDRVPDIEPVATYTVPVHVTEAERPIPGARDLAGPADEPTEADPPRDAHGFTDAEHDTLTELIGRNPARVARLLDMLRQSGAVATEADPYPDGLPENLYVDIESTIHQYCGHDGRSDEANDWVTDLMSAISPLIVRALVGGRSAEECKPCDGLGHCGYCDGDGCGVPTDVEAPPVGDLGVPHCSDGTCTACHGSGLVGGRSAAPTRDEVDPVALLRAYEQRFGVGANGLFTDGEMQAVAVPVEFLAELLSRSAAEPPNTDDTLSPVPDAWVADLNATPSRDAATFDPFAGVTAEPPDRGEIVERFRKALMVAHADDWDMDTVAEAAHVCAEEVTSWPR